MVSGVARLLSQLKGPKARAALAKLQRRTVATEEAAEVDG